MLNIFFLTLGLFLLSACSGSGTDITLQKDSINTLDNNQGNQIGSADFDGDGIPNDLDPDADNDLVLKESDSNDLNPDSDGDDIPDNVDADQSSEPDSDGDGIIDSADVDLTGGTDFDGDGIDDSVDHDDDNDGLSDVLDPNDNNVDSDGDGIQDNVDPDTNTNLTDSDGDGVADNGDANSDFNSTLKDSDGDGIIDIFDNDDDNDGTPDYQDNDDDNDGLTNDVDPDDNNPDTDGDGVPDNVDVDIMGGLDTDGDGIIDTADVDQTGGTDFDGDGIDDAFDTDDDNDGLVDSLDPNDNNVDSDGDGLLDNADPDANANLLDSDSDGIADIADADHPNNSNKKDLDKDGIIDEFDNDVDGDGTVNASDTDDDNDGIPDGTDGQPFDPDSDNDGIIDGADASVTGDPDTDGDGIIDAADPDNGGGADFDGDGISDSHDNDDDNDGLPDYLDADDNNVDQDGDGIKDGADTDANGSLTDADGDGIADIADADHPSNSSQPDFDSDGIIDSYDNDIDGDGVNNLLDNDDDNDGITDALDSFPHNYDSDLDGITDGADFSIVAGTDTDGDGIIDAADVDQAGGLDTDGDGIINDYDHDDDNDGILDAQENVYGNIDTSFTGGTGMVLHDSAAGGASGDYAMDTTIDSNGKILVTGMSHNGTDSEMIVWRYNSNGSLDTTFNNVGFARHNDTAGGAGSDAGRGVAIDSNGKIIVVGSSRNASANSDMVVWRYNSDGSLDTTFNGTGYFIHNSAAGGNGNDSANAVIVDSSDSIIVVGESHNSSPRNEMAVWKLSSDGTLDTSFGGGDGIATFSNAAGSPNGDQGQAVTIDSTGDIVISGYASNGSDWDVAVWKLNPDGSLDTSFGGGDGIVTHANAGAGTYADAWGVAVDSNDRIFVAGRAETSTAFRFDMSLYCFTSAGVLDASFGGGAITHDGAAGGTYDDWGKNVIVDSADNVIVIGQSADTNNGINMTIWRYNSSGSLDTTFGEGDGYVHYNASYNQNQMHSAEAIALDASGNLIIVGDFNLKSQDDDMALWKYTSEGKLDTSFGESKGYLATRGTLQDTLDDQANGIALDSNSDFYIAGYSDNSSGQPDMAIWKYKANGSIDTSFNTKGFISHDNAAGGSGTDSANDIAIDSSGKIVVVGYSENGANSDMAIWRYNTDGTLDTTFNGQGYNVHHNAAGGNSQDRAEALVIDSNDDIYVVGYSTGANQDMAIWKFKSDGTLDTTFNGTGYAVHNNAAGGNNGDQGHDVAIDNNGKIVVTGYSRGTNLNDMAVWRYNTDGSLDTTFSSNGYLSNDNAAGGSSQDYGHSIVVNSEGRIIVAGSSRNGSGDDELAIWKYDDSGNLDTSFGGGSGIVIQADSLGEATNEEAASVILDNNENIIITGFSRPNSTNLHHMIIWNFTSSGSLNTSFDTDGIYSYNGIVRDDDAKNYGNDLVLENGSLYIVGRSQNVSSKYFKTVWKIK